MHQHTAAEKHYGDVCFIAMPRPPREFVAAVTPVLPGDAAMPWVMRASTGMRLVVAACLLVAEVVVQQIAAASDVAVDMSPAALTWPPLV